MNRNILIVEDDEAIRVYLAAILGLEGYAVLQARHGRAALDLLNQRLEGVEALPAVILLDLNMPVMPGREFLSILRTSEAKLAQIPVFVMTAVPDAQDLGTAEFLRKPLDLSYLLDRLKQMVV